MKGRGVIKLREMTAIVLMAVLMLSFVACDEMKKVKNARVNELVQEIKSVENVQKVDAYNMAFDLIIDVYVKDGFASQKEGQSILDSAQKYLTSETVNRLKEEFKQEHIPDTKIYIRDKEGKVFIDISGSCYKSHERSGEPDYAEYVWKIDKW